MQKIGFIGTGIMGGPMAGHLQAAGHQLYLSTHRTPPPAELIEGGAILCDSPKQVAQQSDTIIVMVPDTPQVEQILFADDGIAAGLSDGKLVIDMSSISPIETKEFAERINGLGCDYLDAPVLNCTGKDVPMPYAANLEKHALVTTAEVIDAVKAVTYR